MGSPSTAKGFDFLNAALEAQVEALALGMQEASELLADLAAFNLGAPRQRRAGKPGCPDRWPTRWG